MENSWKSPMILALFALLTIAEGGSVFNYNADEVARLSDSEAHRVVYEEIEGGKDDAISFRLDQLHDIEQGEEALVNPLKSRPNNNKADISDEINKVVAHAQADATYSVQALIAEQNAREEDKKSSKAIADAAALKLQAKQVQQLLQKVNVAYAEASSKPQRFHVLTSKKVIEKATVQAKANPEAKGTSKEAKPKAKVTSKEAKPKAKTRPKKGKVPKKTLPKLPSPMPAPEAATRQLQPRCFCLPPQECFCSSPPAKSIIDAYYAKRPDPVVPPQPKTHWRKKEKSKVKDIKTQVHIMKASQAVKFKKKEAAIATIVDPKARELAADEADAAANLEAARANAARNKEATGGVGMTAAKAERIRKAIQKRITEAVMKPESKSKPTAKAEAKENAKAKKATKPKKATKVSNRGKQDSKSEEGNKDKEGSKGNKSEERNKREEDSKSEEGNKSEEQSKGKGYKGEEEEGNDKEGKNLKKATAVQVQSNAWRPHLVHKKGLSLAAKKATKPKKTTQVKDTKQKPVMVGKTAQKDGDRDVLMGGNLLKARTELDLRKHASATQKSIDASSMETVRAQPETIVDEQGFQEWKEHVVNDLYSEKHRASGISEDYKTWRKQVVDNLIAAEDLSTV